jgi:hypothetical protein
MKISIQGAENLESGKPILRRLFFKVDCETNGETVTGYNVVDKKEKRLGTILEFQDGIFVLVEDFINLKFTEKDHEERAQELLKALKEAKLEITDKITIKSFDEETVELTLSGVDAPVGYYWLGSLFQTPEDQMRYEDFITDSIITKRLEDHCRVKNIEVKEDIKSSLHFKDPSTKEILVPEYIVKQFEQYTFCNNFLLGFEPESEEFKLGKLMRLSPRFCDYMFKEALIAQETGEAMTNDEMFESELNKALKLITKSPYLMELFEKDLIID